jgi:hypothetical protein
MLYAVLACLSLVVAACQTAPSAIADGFCDAAVDARMAMSRGPEVDFDAATEEEINTALGEFAETVNPLLDDIEANAPAEIEDEASTLVANTRTALETGDEAALESDDYQAAEDGVNRYLLDNCDLETHEVEGFDYGYNNVPATAQTGAVAFRFTNTGDELHEMVVFEINDESLTMQQLLEMSEEEAMANITLAGVAFAEPGGNDVLFTELEAGRYGVVCFIPVGTRSSADLPEDEGAATGPPHFTQGMVAEFTVEG